ncbi:hypothetical protein [Paenibacillus sp. sgz500992]|uniref:hypothetical protein n=1 Tax=Paenibacillus sp. sgz500992 TaxID=3242476 RepID=UPI0036D3610F
MSTEDALLSICYFYIIAQRAKLHNGQFSLPGSLVNDQSIYVTGNDYADGSNYGLSDNMISINGSTEEQFRAALRLLELSNSYLLQLPDDADH